jgi:zinc transport system substrate-binding protein
MSICPACVQKSSRVETGKLRVVVTLFPLYDFVRNVGGDDVEVSLLLPPGIEAHSFEPKPEDLLRVARADLFIFTSKTMEPWAEKLAAGVAREGKPLILEAAGGVHYIEAGTADSGKHRHESAHAGALDPHVWLDIRNAQLMIDSIAAALANSGPSKKEQFLAHAAAYKKKLEALDTRFSKGLSECNSRELVHAGHYAFAYLADRYRLKYVSAFGISGESEPSPRKLMELIDTVRRKQIGYIFYEELLSPRIARTIASETGVTLLQLHGIHNLTKAELDGGASYLSLMEQNLGNLKKGLACR